MSQIIAIEFIIFQKIIFVCLFVEKIVVWFDHYIDPTHTCEWIFPIKCKAFSNRGVCVDNGLAMTRRRKIYIKLIHITKKKWIDDHHHHSLSLLWFVLCGHHCLFLDHNHNHHSYLKNLTTTGTTTTTTTTIMMIFRFINVLFFFIFGQINNCDDDN